MNDAVFTSKPDVVEHLGLVLYTDGGARPNPGFIGSGVYGYSYDTRQVADKEISQGFEESEGKQGRVVATTHGWIDQRRMRSAKAQGVKPVTPIDHVQMVISYTEHGTNNKAELAAMNEVLRLALEKGVRKVLLLADSDYSRKCLLEYAPGWSRNNWLKSNGEPPANLELIKEAYGRILEFRSRQGVFEIQWVKGHSGDYGNVRADFLATVAIYRSMRADGRVDVDITSYKKVQTPKTERNPMLSYRRIYFNNNLDAYKGNIIYQGDPGSKDEAQGGKRTADASYSVVVLREPDKLLDEVMRRQFELAPERDAMMQLRLDGVYQKEVQHMVNLYGTDVFTRTTEGACGISFGVDGRPVTVELNPPGLTPRMTDAFNLLEGKLLEYVCWRTNPSALDAHQQQPHFHDITHLFFETQPTRPGRPDKTVLLKTLTNEIKHLQLKIEEPFNGQMVTLTPTLAFGLDILPRNNLKRLEDLNPRVLLLMWRETPNSVRYATVIDTDTGMGIWSNYFSDKLFFKAGGSHA